MIYSEGGQVRIVRRDGGTNSGGWFGDGGGSCVFSGVGDNCTTFCALRAAYNYMSCTYVGSWPHIMNCFDGNTVQPLNDVRVAFPSQEGTTDMDPFIPQITIGNISFCLRILFDYFNLFENSY